MEEIIQSNGVAWLVVHIMDEGSREHGWSPSIEITELYEAEGSQDLLTTTKDFVLEDIERQLWLLNERRRG